MVGAADVLHEMRRYARRYWQGTSKKLQGFSLFVGDTDQWLRLYEGLREENGLSHHMKRSAAHIEL